MADEDGWLITGITRGPHHALATVSKERSAWPARPTSPFTIWMPKKSLWRRHYLLHLLYTTQRETAS